MKDRSTDRPRLEALMTAGPGALVWLASATLVAWALVWLLGKWHDAGRHVVVLVGIVLCCLALGTWTWATTALVSEVRAGIREAAGGARASRRSPLASWVAPLAAPILGVILALSSAQLGHHATSARARQPSTATAPPQKAAASVTYVVRPGDTLKSIATTAYGSADNWTIIARANLGRVEPGGERFVDPTVLRAGWNLTLPAHDGATPRLPQSSHSGSSPWVRDGSIVVLAGLGAFGLALLARRQRARRQLQLVQSPTGAAPPPLDGDDAALELAIRGLELNEVPAWVDAANRVLLADLCRDATLQVPKVSVVRAGSRGVEMLLGEPVAVAPRSFVLEADGMVLRLHPSLDLADVVERHGVTAPAFIPVLVPIAEDESSTFLVALGPGEMLGVVGAPGDVPDLLGSVVSHLSDAPWGQVEIYRCGPTSFAGAKDLPEITVDQLTATAGTEIADPLWRAESQEHQPLVLVEDLETAEAVRGMPLGNIAVVARGVGGSRQLIYEGDEVVIEPRGIRARALWPVHEELSAAARLRAAALAPGLVGSPRALAMGHADLGGAPAEGEFEVVLLTETPHLRRAGGQIVEASSRAFRVLAFLALQRNGQATTGKLSDALPMKGDVRAATNSVHTAVSEARRVVGPAAIQRNPYRLVGVTCDWVRFQALVRLADAARRDAAREIEASHLSDALALFEDLVDPGNAIGDWLEVQSCSVHVVAKAVADAADQLAAAGEELGDPGLVSFAIDHGRRAMPHSEPLARRAMRLAAVQGDQATLELEIQGAYAAVDELGIDADLAPETERLVAQLRPRPVRGSFPPGSDVA